MFDSKLRTALPDLNLRGSKEEDIVNTHQFPHDPSLLLVPLECIICNRETKGGFKCEKCGVVVHLGCLADAKELNCIGVRKITRSRDRTGLGASLPENPTKISTRMTFLIHGYADNLQQWEKIRGTLEHGLGHPVHLFSYNSYDNKSTIENIAVCFDVFVKERLNLLNKARELQEWMNVKRRLWMECRDIIEQSNALEGAPIEEIESVKRQLEKFIEKVKVKKHRAEGAKEHYKSERLEEYQTKIQRKINSIDTLLHSKRADEISEKESHGLRCEVAKHFQEVLKRKKDEAQRPHSSLLLEKKEKEDLANTERELNALATKPSLKGTGHILNAWIIENIPDTLLSEKWGEFVKEVQLKVYPPVKGGVSLLSILNREAQEIVSCSDTSSILPAEDSHLHYFMRYISESEGNVEKERLIGLAFSSEADSQNFASTFFTQPDIPIEESAAEALAQSVEAKQKNEEEKEIEQQQKKVNIIDVKERDAENVSSIFESIKARREQFNPTVTTHATRRKVQLQRLHDLPILYEKKEEPEFLNITLKQAIEIKKKEKEKEEEETRNEQRNLAKDNNDIEEEEDEKMPPVKVDIICYSTGSLILRYFLKMYYYLHYDGVIDHVAMFAPANLGSPCAVKAKEGLGRVIIGEKSFENFLGCGLRLLTSLECPSPFNWNLTSHDCFLPQEQQYLNPEKIKVSIYQGAAIYTGAKSFLRGDMYGTDGTVTVTGASLRPVRIELTLTSAQEGAAIFSSNADVCYKIFPQFNHATIIASLENGEEAYRDLFTFLRSVNDVSTFKSHQEEFKAANAEAANSVNFGKLMIWRLSSTSLLTEKAEWLRFAVISLGKGIHPSFGKHYNLPALHPLDAPQVLKGFNKAKKHTVDTTAVYMIVDTKTVNENLKALSDSLQMDAGVVVFLADKPEFAKLICCSSWLESFGSHFGAYDSAALVQID